MKVFIITCLFSIILVHGCTNNPFFSDEIKDTQKLMFSGTVTVPNSDDNSGIQVYVEGLDLDSRTDKNGNFKIIMPLKPGLQPGGGLTGFYNVYYYVANYQLTYSTVFMDKGEFAYGIADLDKNGKIRRKIVLRQILDVKTTVNPEKIKKHYSGKVTVTVRLENKVDSVIVFSQLTKKKNLASTFLSGKDPQKNIYLLIQPSNLSAVVIDSLKYWTMDINWPVEGTDIDVGLYDVIPYIYVYQPDIPDELLEKIGNDVTDFTKEYLKIPFRRQTPKFNITKDSN